MHLRLSIVFEKFLKEKNKSKKDRSFAPSTFRLSAEPSLFSSARRRASVPPRKAAPFPKERGAAPPPAKIPLDLPFSRVRPCQTAGARNRKKSAAALSRPPFVPPLLWKRFFLRRGTIGKKAVDSLPLSKIFHAFPIGAARTSR